MKNSTFVAFALVSMILSSPAPAAKDTIVFSAAPTEKPDNAQTFDTPLLDLVPAGGKKMVMVPRALPHGYPERTLRIPPAIEPELPARIGEARVSGAGSKAAARLLKVQA